MAARENTYIHAALILMVMGLILVGGLAYYYSQQARIHVSKSIDADNKAQEALLKLQVEEFKTRLLRHMLGDTSVTVADITALRSNYDETQYPEVKKLEDQFNKDIADNGHGLPEGMTYRDIMKNVFDGLIQRSASYEEQSKREKDFEADLATERKARAAETAAFKKAADDSKTGLQNALAQHDIEMTRKDKERTGMLASHQKQLGSLRTEKDKLQGEKVALEQKTVTQQNTIITMKNEKEENEKETFDVADGRVTGVNLTKGEIYINLGLIDGLRKGITFGVYPPKSNGILRNVNEQKAKIEVIDVVDQRFAICKINEDILRQPIAPGDQIHTPAWRPGVKVRFALVGDYDLNGDGVDDRQLVRNLIAANNGVIDAEVDADGSMTGKITPRTRYIIKGDIPADVAKVDGYKTFMDSARYNGVRALTQDEFVGYMGWSEEIRTITLGRNARSSDFRKKRNLQTNDQPGNVFRNRQPPARGKNGAF